MAQRTRTLLLEIGLIMTAIVLGKLFDSPFGYCTAGILALGFLVAWYRGKEGDEEEFTGSSLFGKAIATAGRMAEGIPNVVFGNTISMQNVVEDAGRFRVFVPFESAKKMLAITVDARNPAADGQVVASAGQVKAQLCFKLKQGEYDIAPGAWLDELYSSVRLDTGDTRRLIIAVSDSYPDVWKMVSNKRTGADDHVSLDHTRDVPLSAAGTLEIKLIGSGRVLRTLTTRLTWPYQHGLVFTGMQQS